MKNRTLIAALVLAPLVSTAVFAKDDTSWLTPEYLENTLKSMIAQGMNQPGFEAVAACAGMSKQEAGKALEKAFRGCYDQYLKTGDGTQVEQCLDKGPQTALGLSEREIDACMAKKGFVVEETAEEQLASDVEVLREQMMSLQSSIDALYDMEDRSEADDARLEQLQAQYDELGQRLNDAENGLHMAEMSPTERKLMEMMDKIGEREPTASEEAELRKLGEQLRQERIAAGNNLMKGLD